MLYERESRLEIDYSSLDDKLKEVCHLYYIGFLCGSGCACG